MAEHQNVPASRLWLGRRARAAGLLGCCSLITGGAHPAASIAAAGWGTDLLSQQVRWVMSQGTGKAACPVSRLSPQQPRGYLGLFVPSSPPQRGAPRPWLWICCCGLVLPTQGRGWVHPDPSAPRTSPSESSPQPEPHGPYQSRWSRGQLQKASESSRVMAHPGAQGGAGGFGVIPLPSGEITCLGGGGGRGGGGERGRLWSLHHRGRVQTPLDGSSRTCLVLGNEREARPWGRGDGEEGVLGEEEGRVSP